MLFKRYTVCTAKMAEPIDDKAPNRLRYTLSVSDVTLLRHVVAEAERKDARTWSLHVPTRMQKICPLDTCLLQRNYNCRRGHLLSDLTLPIISLT